MRIKIEMTVDVNPYAIRKYQNDLDCDETIPEFVRSYVVLGGFDCLEQSLMNNGFDHAVELRGSKAR